MKKSCCWQKHFSEEICFCKWRFIRRVSGNGVKYEKQCWKCGQTTDIITYIVYESDRTSLVYPWDKIRLNEERSFERTMAHREDPDIEWYPLLVVGNDEKLHALLMKAFPDKIKIKYSKTMEKSYPMNICRHCGAIQGQNYVYRDINKYIQRMASIAIVQIESGNEIRA
jgi:hypothetical protein